MGKRRTDYRQMFLVDSLLYYNNNNNRVNVENLTFPQKGELEPLDFSKQSLNDALPSSNSSKLEPPKSDENKKKSKLENKYFGDENYKNASTETCLECSDSSLTQSMGSNMNQSFYQADSFPQQKPQQIYHRVNTRYNPYKRSYRRYINNHTMQHQFPPVEHHRNNNRNYQDQDMTNLVPLQTQDVNVVPPIYNLKYNHEAHFNPIQYETIPMQTDEKGETSVQTIPTQNVNTVPLNYSAQSALTQNQVVKPIQYINDERGIVYKEPMRVVPMKVDENDKRDVHPNESREVIPMQTYDDNTFLHLEPRVKIPVQSEKSKAINYWESRAMNPMQTDDNDATDKYKEKIIYICSLCNSSFGKKNTLQRHMNNVHGVFFDGHKKGEKRKTIMDVCEYCGDYFKNKKTLNRHIENIHEAYFQINKGTKRSLKQKKTKSKYMKYN